MMSWRRVFKSLQVVVAHGLLFSFTLILSLKLHRANAVMLWSIFSPLWLFHAVVARGRFSLPAPSMPHGRYWAPFHAIVATPLLVAFELLLCVHLERSYAVSLKIVFLPLIALEIAILVDNIRMCRALMPGEEDNITDEAIWETLPHFWVSIAMVFFIAATTFTLLKLCGDVAALGCVAECFAFLICTKWYNPAIHRRSHLTAAASSSSMNMRYLSWNNGFWYLPRKITKKIECAVCKTLGTPPAAKYIPIPLLFSPLLLLQGAGFLFAIYRFFEKITLLIHDETDTGSTFRLPATAYDYMGFLRRGSRLLGWWSIDEGSREEQARLYSAYESGYNTFSPDTVKKMPKAELAKEIWRLQSALVAQTEITNISQEEFERLQNERILCRVCFDEQINVVLLPCRHYVLCRPGEYELVKIDSVHSSLLHHGRSSWFSPHFSFLLHPPLKSEYSVVGELGCVLERSLVIKIVVFKHEIKRLTGPSLIEARDSWA
ncbi:hypothetical protein DH2020_011953 [Rehmannia glutinosa]|uniref:Uncharacterized protein n=1 Tax=Rehmannia glutinosa TaxID=99300 RepID=A0ABR0XEV8_REHGL